jgi:hypothetical protein
VKSIGLIGGMSWESSVEYYRIINEVMRDRLGGLHSAKSIMISPDFAEIEILQREGRWDEATLLMIEIARQVERGRGIAWSESCYSVNIFTAARIGVVRHHQYLQICRYPCRGTGPSDDSLSEYRRRPPRCSSGPVP